MDKVEYIKKYFPEVIHREYNSRHYVGIRTNKFRWITLGVGDSELEAYNNAYNFLMIVEQNDPKE